MRTFISVFILMLVTSTARAGVDYWVWVDKNGVTNYAELEPHGISNARHVTTSVPFGERDPATAGKTATNVPAADGADKTTASAVNPEAAIAGKKSAIKAEIAQVKRKNCEIGKDSLAKLESYKIIKVKGTDGKVRVLSPQEHQQRIEQARDTIRQNCSS